MVVWPQSSRSSWVRFFLSPSQSVCARRSGSNQHWPAGAARTTFGFHCRGRSCQQHRCGLLSRAVHQRPQISRLATWQSLAGSSRTPGGRTSGRTVAGPRQSATGASLVASIVSQPIATINVASSPHSLATSGHQAPRKAFPNIESSCSRTMQLERIRFYHLRPTTVLTRRSCEDPWTATKQVLEGAPSRYHTIVT